MSAMTRLVEMLLGERRRPSAGGEARRFARIVEAEVALAEREMIIDWLRSKSMTLDDECRAHEWKTIARQIEIGAHRPVKKS